MIAKSLETCLHMAFVDTRLLRHEYVTVEHLLLALLSDASVIEALHACSANVEELREQISLFLKENTPIVVGKGDVDSQPTLGFQRVVQRAIMHVQTTGNGEVTPLRVLIAIFGEKNSYALNLLHQQGVTQTGIVNLIRSAPVVVSDFRKALDKANGEDSLSYRFTVTEVRRLFRLAELGNITAERLEDFFKKSHEEATA